MTTTLTYQGELTIVTCWCGGGCYSCIRLQVSRWWVK